MRWPPGRVVFNNAEPFLGAQPTEPVALSAELLRAAVAAQDGGEGAVRELTRRSGGLKCVDLSGLGPQDLWAFWLNVFHCLLVHAQLVAGRPRNLQQTIGFFNRSCYLVAGHAFSLVEIEHCILRRHMTKPHVRLARVVLKVWPRSDEDLERRPCLAAPPCSAACFGGRPDWRLNLVLNAGNLSSADALPVFEASGEAAFEETVRRAMERTLTCCGSLGAEAVELPFALWRYRGDAPPGGVQEPPARRWAQALGPKLVQAGARVGFVGTYDWTMRERLTLLPPMAPGTPALGLS